MCTRGSDVASARVSDDCSNQLVFSPHQPQDAILIVWLQSSAFDTQPASPVRDGQHGAVRKR